MAFVLLFEKPVATMDINFKFLPAFLGALALTATLGASGKPAPRQAEARPVTARPAPPTAASAGTSPAATARAAGESAVLLVATRKAGAPQRPAADQDDW